MPDFIEQFSIRHGSATGWGHLLAGKGNQDAWKVRKVTNKGIILVVTDGCTGIPHPEVGAWTGADMLSDLLAQAVEKGAFATDDRDELIRTCEQLFKDMISACNALAALIAQPFFFRGEAPPLEEIIAVIEEYMFFTVVAAVITPSFTTVISFGDGVYAINDEIFEIKTRSPDSRYAPPYLGHHMDGISIPLPQMEEYYRFQIQYILPTEKLNSLLIGSDGALALMAAENALAPGCRKKTIGPLSQLWKNARFAGAVKGNFGEVTAITYWLMTLASKTAKKAVKPILGGNPIIVFDDKFPELMADDTTVLLAQRV